MKQTCKYCVVNEVGYFNEFWCENRLHPRSFCDHRSDQESCTDYKPDEDEERTVPRNG